MTREMYDAVTPTNIPTNAQMVAGYLPPSGYAWSQASWDRFPHSVKVQIAVRASTNAGHVLDVENGDATAAQAPGWAHMRQASGYAWPTIYTSVSNQQAVINAFNAAGEPQPLWWLAHYDNLDTLPPGAIAKQYADPGPVDRSIVADYWPGVDGANPVTNPVENTIESMVADIQLRVASIHAKGFLPWQPGAPGGDLGWFQQQMTLALAPVLAQLTAIEGSITAEQAAIIAAMPAPGAPTDAQMATLAAAIEATYPTYTLTKS